MGQTKHKIIFKTCLFIGLLPSSAQAPVQPSHPPTRDNIKTVGWEAYIQLAILIQTN